LPVIHHVIITTNGAIAGRLEKRTLETAIEAIGNIGTVGGVGKIIRGPECPAVHVLVSLNPVKCG
jgi:hypothetical protein